MVNRLLAGLAAVTMNVVLLLAWWIIMDKDLVAAVIMLLFVGKVFRDGDMIRRHMTSFEKEREH